MKVSTFCKRSKIWYYFVGTRFMPSAHLSDVAQDRAILIYCILSGKTIDVGSILHAFILHNVKGVSVGLYFPSLITALCEKAGVSWGSSEEVVQPVHTIDTRIMLTFKGWDRGASSSSTSKIGQPPTATTSVAQYGHGRSKHLEDEFVQFRTY